MLSLNPYLMFNGNCEEAFNRYHEVLGGRIEAMLRHKGSPAEEHVPAEWQDKIMHACLIVGDFRLMASDAPPGHQEPMRGWSVNIGVDSIPEAERIFSALAEGGETRMPLQKTFWSERFGMLVDRFGTPWMVNCTCTAG